MGNRWAEDEVENPEWHMDESEALILHYYESLTNFLHRRRMNMACEETVAVLGGDWDDELPDQDS